MSLSAIFQNFRHFPLRSNNLKTCVCVMSWKNPSQKITKEVDPDTGEITSKKTAIIPKITLLSGDSIRVTTLLEAEKLSKRRDLKLVRVVDVDVKTQRPVYRLLTGSEYHAEDLKQREQRKLDRQNIKGEKVLLINSKITQHDLDTQLRKATKWLSKMYEVRVIITGANGNIESSEKIYSNIEQHYKHPESEAKVVQKRLKGCDIKFQILPGRKVQRGSEL